MQEVQHAGARVNVVEPRVYGGYDSERMAIVRFQRINAHPVARRRHVRTKIIEPGAAVEEAGASRLIEQGLICGRE